MAYLTNFVSGADIDCGLHCDGQLLGDVLSDLAIHGELNDLVFRDLVEYGAGNQEIAFLRALADRLEDALKEDGSA